MPNLIVGETTETTAIIWVRGDPRHRACEITVHTPSHPARDEPRQSQQHQIELSENTDFTGISTFRRLKAGTTHTVTATFGAEPEQSITGRFSTFPGSADGTPIDFSFVLSSCNLSIVSINNLLALLLATGGSSAAESSLDLPVDRWKFPGTLWLRRLSRPLVKGLLELVAAFVMKATGAKQPGPPYIRSPFLKLSGVFDSWILELANVERPAAAGDAVTAPGARGVVVSATEVTRKIAVIRNGRPDWEVETRWLLVLTQVEGRFTRSELRCGDAARRLGDVTNLAPGRPWLCRPSFFLHVGDQIYYDFPNEDRRPARDEYRLAYREAWSDDDANRHLLSHWPHYMMLDDHEFADQFSCDFVPPAVGSSADDYLHEATAAYREYVQARNPPQENNPAFARKETGPYWYQFNKGAARFFVLDTRTQRFDCSAHGAQIIDDTQMKRLLEWMNDYKDDLKFVITSVPFVAQINDEENQRALRWTSRRRPEPDPTQDSLKDEPINPENDKWCARRFKGQRDQIIKHIADNGIEHLVFLTGDMHCCYHASMRIGTGSKYQTTTVHELAGGPVNQLQLANIAEFEPRCTGRTEGEHGVDYEIVLDRFHSQVNAVMHLRVKYVDREVVDASSPSTVPEIEWNVIRTLTDNGAFAWAREHTPDEWWTDRARDKAVKIGEPTMTGRISFTRKRKPENLTRWSDAERQPGARLNV